MNDVLKIMDDQMLKWVAELNDLYKEKADVDRAIHELEQNVDIARKVSESMKTN